MEESGLSDDEPDHDYRRRHTLANTKEQACQVCVCSVEGKDEHCQSRPAHNVNECIRMTYLAQKYKSGLLPFELGRNIHQAIRRGWWRRAASVQSLVENGLMFKRLGFCELGANDFTEF